MFSSISVSQPHSKGPLARCAVICLLSSQFTAAASVPDQPANPPRLTYATYAASDPKGSILYGFAVDSAGYAYLGGEYSGCAFLTKLNQAGAAALWSMCLPLPRVNAIAVDGQGHIYVAGNTQFQPLSSDLASSTILKLTPDGAESVYSTSIAGTYVTKIVLDRTGSAYLTGWTGPGFKATPGAYLTAGGQVFVAKLDGSGTVQYATYVDFVSSVRGNSGIAVDSLGQIWAVGATCPTAAGVGSNCSIVRYGTATGIRKLDADGAKLLVSKTFGGGPAGDRFLVHFDAGLGVAVDSGDSVWVVGSTESSDVPTSPGALQPKWPPNVPAYNGVGGIGYTVKLSPSGDFLYGTYVGANPGVGDRTINSVAVDGEGRPFFALNLDSSGSAGLGCASASATVMALSPDASALVFSTDLLSTVQTIALDGNGGLYAAGNTKSMAFLATPGVYQQFYTGGSQGGYAAKFDLTKSTPSQFQCVKNAATLVPGDNPSLREGAVAPGEIVTLVGKALPPDPRVTFDGFPAPILYADANQINAVVPFEVTASNTVVSVNDIGSYTLPVWPAVPGLFTANATGSGQLAALNEDGGVNSSVNPAKPGSVVVVYMTGVGAMAPPIGDGELGPLEPPYPAPVLGASAVVYGMAAPVLFAGQAPGLIAGAVQVNVQVPPDTPSGDVPLVVYIGNYQTQIARTTIAVSR